MIRIPRRYRRALVAFVTAIGLAALTASCGAVQAQGNAAGVQTLRAVSPYGGDRAAEGEPQRGGTLRVGTDRDAVSSDPVVQNANQAASVVYDSLLRLTPDGRTEPFVAKSMGSPDAGSPGGWGCVPG